jgi:pyridoxamine 5'-phosphate oxidase
MAPMVVRSRGTMSVRPLRQILTMIETQAALFARVRQLLDDARAAGDSEPTAMTLASADSNGRLSTRTVLLKALDAHGFVFYTNHQSNKARQLYATQRAALTFLWKPLKHQVQINVEGAVETVSPDEADAYFGSRPRLSQIGAWASHQSQALLGRDELLARVAAIEQRFADQPVPRPPHWSGFRIVPSLIECWFGEPGRLHVRERFEPVGSHWVGRLLNP